MKKRLLAAIMSLCMIFSLLPVSALAYEGDEESAVQSRDGGYPAYFYVRFPSDGTEEDTHAQSLFTFAGTGSVSGVEAPNYYTGANKVVGVTDGIMLNPPAGGNDETHNHITVSQFPDISYDTKTYVYEGKATDADPYTYTVEWYRLVSEKGYNIIHKGTSYSFSVSENDGYCWHVDGFIQFQDRHSVTYKVQFPGETGFSDVTASGEKETENIPYVDYLDKDKAFGDATAPSMDETKEYQGETYTFEGWYEDEGCTQEIGVDDVITENITVYGKYVKKGPDITVTKELATVNGVDVVRDPEDTVLHVGDSVTWTVKVKNNNPDETLMSLTMSDSLLDSSPAGTVSITPVNHNSNYTSFGLNPGETKEFSVFYTRVDESYKNGNLENTVTVTYSGKEYKATATNTVLPVEPTGESAYFYILLPGKESVAEGDAADYRYLTYGGHVNETLADELKESAPAMDQNDEGTITQYLTAWPENLLQYPAGKEPDDSTVASQPIGNQSTWEINEETGDVTSFSIVIDGKTYTNVDWDIRWVKIGYVDIANSTVPSDHGYHVDAMLYKKTLAEEVINEVDGVAKDLTNDQLSLGEKGTENESETFKFVLDAKNDTGKAFKDIPLNVTFTESNKADSLKLTFVNEDDAKRELIPGTYVISEQLTEEQDKAWTSSAVEFAVNRDGTITYTNDNSVIDNTLETYTLTYDANEGTGGPAAQSGLKYNEFAEISTIKPTRDNHTFLGWATTANATVSDVTGPVQIKGDTTLYAVWQLNTAPTMYTVTFNTNGGTTPSWSQSVEQGQAVNKPTDPVWNDDYIFMGWTTETIPGRTYGVGASLPDMVFQNSTPFTPAGNTTLYAVWGEDRNHDDVADVYEVFIAPADITIYTGGMGYEGVSDGDGNEIENSNSGLPEPGFHIILPADLNMGFGEYLDEKVRFTYQGSDDLAGGAQVTRKWTLSFVGTYSDQPRQYVYSLESAPGTPAIRVTYTDPVSGAVLEDDDIGMTEDAAHGTYTMSINSGGLTPSAIQAVITTADGTPVTRSLVIGTGELTIRSTVDDDTTPIAGNEDEVSGGSFTAVHTGASYKVNDSEVDVPTTGDRVHLLVDEVSDSPDFNNAMGEAALDHANMPNASYETAYLDLVDSQNGNTVVTLDNGSMDIYWPMPSDADPSGTFQVVHYVDMNREVSASEGSLDTQETELLDGTAERINGDWYVRFTTHSFSPFVLVYEEDTSRPVNPNPGGGSGGDSDSDPTGNLSIELDVNGGDDEFTFTVILTDKDGDDLENNFYYNGDYTGTIGSGDEITLEGGDKIVIRNLPEGTRYEVIIETADGYTYVIDGEEGVIHTGMNEAEFTATRTVPVADPSVTGVSRWLNTTDHIAYLTGYPGGAFGPDNNMTRAEVAQMFYALLNNKNVTITKTFPDVPADAWYATAVNTLASLGMVSGDENGNYRPNDPITRAEFCVIALAFAYEPENAVCYFGDVSRSDWFYTYVAQAASYGWIGGYTNGNFGPNDRITRAQVTTIVNNMLGRAADRDYVIDHQADLVQFTDLTRAHWGYFQIMEATNAHDYTKSNGTENWR